MNATKEQAPRRATVGQGAQCNDCTPEGYHAMIPSAIRHPEHGRIRHIAQPTGARVALITYADFRTRTWQHKRVTIRPRQVNWPRITMSIGLTVLIVVFGAVASILVPLPLMALYVIICTLIAVSIITL